MKKEYDFSKVKVLDGSPQPHDKLLGSLVRELVNKNKCHTVVLYGSRARGDVNKQSDYDLMGVRKSGKKYRIARKQDGFYVDIFVYPEKDLTKPNESHLYMMDGRILYQKGIFGSQFMKKLKSVAMKKHKPLPADEIQVRRIWLHKMFERSGVGDIEGNYRRSWLHEALLYEYFYIRKKRYFGSKQSFAWLKENDKTTYLLFEKVLAKPLERIALKRLVERVSKIKS